MPRVALEDADLHLAAETLRTVSTGSYEFGVSVMDVDARRRLCAMFAEKVIEGIARGEQLDQARLLVVEGVPQHLPQPACFQSGAFNFSTEVVDARRKGVGGRLVYSARVAKNGPLRQRITSVVSGNALPSQQVELDVCWNQYYAYLHAPTNNPEQHSISRVQQVQVGSGYQIHIYSNLSVTTSDTLGLRSRSKVEIQNLHERLDGIHSIEQSSPQASYIITNKTRQYALTAEELTQIEYRLQQANAKAATVSLFCTVKQDTVLHWLTLAAFPKAQSNAADSGASVQTPFPTLLQEALNQHEATLVMHNEQQHHVLPSRVLQQQASSQHAAAAASSNHTSWSSFPDWVASMFHELNIWRTGTDHTISQQASTLQQHTERLDVSDAHLLDVDEGIDVIVKQVYSTPMSAKQPGTPEKPGKSTQSNAAASSSRVAPFVSTPEATTFHHESQLPEYPGPDDPLVHALAGWESPGAHYRAMHDESDDDGVRMSEPPIMPPAPQPPAPHMQQSVTNTVRRWDPFYMISDSDLQDAVLQVLPAYSKLSVLDIVDRVWPVGEADNRPLMKCKGTRASVAHQQGQAMLLQVNKILRSLKESGQLKCQALKPPQWSHVHA